MLMLGVMNNGWWFQGSEVGICRHGRVRALYTSWLYTEIEHGERQGIYDVERSRHSNHQEIILHREDRVKQTLEQYDMFVMM